MRKLHAEISDMPFSKRIFVIFQQMRYLCCFLTANTHNPSDDLNCFKNISKVKQLEIFMKRREIYLYFLKGRSYMCK